MHRRCAHQPRVMSTTMRCWRDCERSTMSFDDDINCALALIDTAASNCYPDHKDDTDQLRKLSHRAWDTLRTFRQEVLHTAKELLGEEDARLLDPGGGSKAFKELLGRMLEYTEARSRVAVEIMRMKEMDFFNKVGAFPETSMQQRREGKPLTYSRLQKELTRAVRLHVERVVDAAEVKLETADLHVGPVDVRKWRGFALFVLIASKRVNDSIELGHKTMASFEERLAGKDRAIRMEAQIVEGNKEGKRQREEIGTKILNSLGNQFGLLQKQIDVVLRDMNAVRILQESGTCPRAYFLVPADKSTWSFAKKADSFSNLYTRNVELFFVCRMFFEDLREAAAKKAAAKKEEACENALIDHHSDTNFEHEFSHPIPLELPKRVVAERLHAIRVSVKIIKILVDAASLGLSLGNLIPSLKNYKEQDELFNVVQSHLVLAEDEAANGELAEDITFLGSPARWMKKLLKCRPASTRPGTARSPTHAHQVLQGYLDKEHPGVWQDKVRPKLSITPNLGGTDFAYICENTSQHKLDWKGKL